MRIDKIASIAALGLIALSALAAVFHKNLDFFLLTGYFRPVEYVEALDHPIAVARWDEAGLWLADGRHILPPDIGALKPDSPLLAAAVKNGVELAPDGHFFCQLKIRHWCGNDPVRFDLRRLDLTKLLLAYGECSPAPGLPRIKTPDNYRLDDRGLNSSDFASYRFYDIELETAAALQNEKPPHAPGDGAGIPTNARIGEE